MTGVPCATPVPVIEHVAPTLVFEYIAPAPLVTNSSPSQQLSPAYTMEQLLDDLIDSQLKDLGAQMEHLVLLTKHVAAHAASTRILSAARAAPTRIIASPSSSSTSTNMLDIVTPLASQMETRPADSVQAPSHAADDYGTAPCLVSWRMRFTRPQARGLLRDALDSEATFGRGLGISRPFLGCHQIQVLRCRQPVALRAHMYIRVTLRDARRTM